MLNKNWKKTAILILLCNISAFLYAETYLNVFTGFTIFTDHYPEDDYSRKQIGFNLNAALYYFPGDFPLGFFTRISYNGTTPVMEEIKRESMEPRKCSIMDLRAVIAPSFMLKPRSNIHIPLSIGPILVFTNEKSTEKLISTNTNYSYQSLGGGIHANSAVFIFFPNGLFISPGISFDYIFLRAEKGEMRMNYRTTHNDSFKRTSYYALNFSVYCGMGILF